MKAKPSRSLRAKAVPVGQKYVVTILGRQPSEYAEERVRALKANRRTCLWIQADAGSGLAVESRDRNTMKRRDRLRGQGARALKSLFLDPVQELAELFSGGGAISRKKAFDRLREAIDHRDRDGEWVLLGIHTQDGKEIVSFQTSKGRLCVLVQPKPGGLPPVSGRLNGTRVQGRSAFHHHSGQIVVIELRLVDLSPVPIDADDLGVLVDGKTLKAVEPSFAKQLFPDYTFPDRLHAEPGCPGPWGWFSFDASALELPLPENAETKIVKVRVKLFNGLVLHAVVNLVPDISYRL